MCVYASFICTFFYTTIYFDLLCRPRITKIHFKETQFEIRVLGKDVSEINVYSIHNVNYICVLSPLCCKSINHTSKFCFSNMFLVECKKGYFIIYLFFFSIVWIYRFTIWLIIELHIGQYVKAKVLETEIFQHAGTYV